jgi:hypothetical protein
LKGFVDTIGEGFHIIEWSHDYSTPPETERRNGRRAPSVVRSFGASPVARRIPRISYLSESQHHDSRDIRRVVHGHDVIPPLPTTAHYQNPSYATIWRANTHARSVTFGHLGHHFGVTGSERVCVGSRRRIESSCDTVSICERASHTARPVAVA